MRPQSAPPSPADRWFERLADLAETVGTATDLDQIFRALQRFIGRTVPYHALLVSLQDPDTGLRRCVYHAQFDQEFDVSALPPMGPSDSPHSRAVTTGEVVVSNHLQASLAGSPSLLVGGEADPRYCESSIAVPMAVPGRVIGGFEIQAIELGAYREEHIAPIRMAASLCAIAIEQVRLLDRERELRQEAEDSRQRYADLVEGLDAVVWEGVHRPRELDGAVRFTFVSRRVEALLGYPVERWLEEPGFRSSIIHPEDRERAVELSREAIREAVNHDSEYRMITADGRVLPVRDIVRVEPGAEGGARLRGILVDVTETKRLEEELFHTRKMEVVGRLAGGVAHDFNNLLTVIAGNVDVLLSEAPPGPLVEGLREIRDAAERATGLTGQLLAFSRRQPARARNLKLDATIANMARMLSRLIGEHVALELDLGSADAVVRADPVQVEQVLANLAVNARDAMPAGGRLRIASRPAGDDVELTVRDEGRGMDAETRAHAFEPFFTTRAEGTGLGLATVYGIVTGYGGTVQVDSSPGRGTTFTIRWPRTADPADPAEIRPGPAEVAAVSGATILVVEDEKPVRSLIARVLTGAGYVVVQAANGEEALERLAAAAAPIDLLLTDVVMPGMGGHRLAQAVRADHPRLPILFMSGYDAESFPGRGDAPAGPQLVKPFLPRELLQQVREMLPA